MHQLYNILKLIIFFINLALSICEEAVEEERRICIVGEAKHNEELVKILVVRLFFLNICFRIIISFLFFTVKKD